MEKLLDTISNSCKELKEKGILTYDDYQKCKKIYDEENTDDIKNEEYLKYLDSVYEEPSDRINEDETQKYKKYKKLFDTNIDNLMKAYNTDDINLIYRYNTNLQKIKDEIKKIIENYEKKINNTKSHEIYKEMVLKNRNMNEILKQIDKYKNDLYSIKKKKDNIINKKYKKHITLKNYIIFFIILLFIIIILFLKLKSNV